MQTPYITKQAFVLVRRDNFQFLSFPEPLQWTPYMHKACLFSKEELENRGWYRHEMEFNGAFSDKGVSTYLVDVVRLEVAQSRKPSSTF